MASECRRRANCAHIWIRVPLCSPPGGPGLEQLAAEVLIGRRCVPPVEPRGVGIDTMESGPEKYGLHSIPYNPVHGVYIWVVCWSASFGAALPVDVAQENRCFN